MAKVIHVPSDHRCQRELDNDLGPVGDQKIGTIAECSCGRQFKVAETQFDGTYWAPQLPRWLRPSLQNGQ
jgi:hypothetical protein